MALRLFNNCKYWNVARALRDHRYQSSARFFTVVMGDVFTDDVRLVDVYRHAGNVFFTLLFLFVRFVPVISIFEVRTLLPEANVHGHHQDFEENVNEVEYTYDRTDPPNQ